MRNRVEVLPSHPRADAYAQLLVKKGRAYLKQLSLSGCELSISLVSDRAIRRLNRTWRRKDKPTDVLSFPAGDLPQGIPGPRPLGDVVISVDMAERRAREDGRPVQAELLRYLAHGVLHLLGHDHHKPAEAKRMAALEEELLGNAGMVRTAGIA